MVSRERWVVAGTATEPNEPLGTGARIAITADGGRSWRTTLTAHATDLWWLGRDGHRLVAAGAAGTRNGYGRPVEEISDDDGRSWRTIYPRVPARLWPFATQISFSGHGAAVALTNPDQASSFFSSEDPQGVLRSSDDGLDWRLVPLPGHGVAYGTASWLPGGRSVFVTGVSAHPSAHCSTAIWRSNNAGASFQRITGSCDQNAVAVSFHNPKHGLIAYGDDPAYTAGQFVRATHDGGHRWRTIWQNTAQHGEPGLIGLTFTDPQHGWAIAGGIHTSANAPYTGDLLVTSNAGRDWTDTHTAATGISALPGGAALAWTNNGRDLASLHLTYDNGRTWTTLTRPTTPPPGRAPRP